MNKNAKRLLIIFITLLVLYTIELVYIYQKSIIINVDGINITKHQFDKVFDKNANASGFAMLGIDIKKDKNGFIYMLIKDKTVEDLLKQSVIEEEIQKKHIKAGNEELRKKKLAESVASIAVSNEEAKKYYQEHLDKFRHEESVKISHIFITANHRKIESEIKAKPENSALSQEEIHAMAAREVTKQREKAKLLHIAVMNNPNSFKKVARENSDDKTSASKGGELGYATRSQMSDEISKVVFTIKPNTISEIVQTKNGYHILLVTDRKKASEDSFGKVKAGIVAILEKQKQDEVLDALSIKLKKQAKIKYINPDYTPKSIENRLNSSKNDGYG
jgi:parvulin-like peptidyl-prolyl isomerase